jgi:hypothetical protein
MMGFSEQKKLIVRKKDSSDREKSKKTVGKHMTILFIKAPEQVRLRT